MRQVLIIGVLLSTVGCFRGLPKDKPPLKEQTNMYVQPRYETQGEGAFFPDGAAMRVPPEGTVARGSLNEDLIYYTGQVDSEESVARIPVPVTMALIERGRDRFNIYCAPCHSRLGDGQGMVVQRGMIPPPSFYITRLVNANDGDIFDVITNGVRNMPSYRYQIPVADRWAIVAYFRALQKSHTASLGDLPGAERAKLQQGNQ